MEPVTHILTGACLARTGLNRRAAYTTAAMAIAAEFPDIDTLWGIRGPISSFQHHRGITHTLLGLPFEAALLLALFYAFHRWRARHLPAKIRKTPAPTRWPILYAFILLALLSHLLLDFTNNYGIRPFFPFNPHWYAASIVFIVDPLLLLFLLAGLLLPSLFALISQEVGARRPSFRGAGWARAALAAVLLLWLVRTWQHSTALALAGTQTLERAAPDTSSPEAAPNQTLTPQKIIANPDPLNPFRWYTAIDFGPAYQLGTANTRANALATTETLNKPTADPYVQAAKESHLGRAYLDWSSMPWLSSDEGTFADSSGLPNSSGLSDPKNPEVTVLFEDLRFMGASPLLHRGNSTPLTGIVVLDRAKHVLEQGIDGRFER